MTQDITRELGDGEPSPAQPPCPRISFATFGVVAGDQKRDPTPQELESPLFNAIWKAIKGWDISRENNGLYSGPTGTDVCIILDSILESGAAQEVSPPSPLTCESNSITYRAPEVVSHDPEPEKCPTCKGYHLGGCHRRADITKISATPANTVFTEDALGKVAEGDTRELKAALRKLANEAKGFLSMAVREAHGNTNMRIFAERIVEAEKLLG